MEGKRKKKTEQVTKDNEAPQEMVAEVGVGEGTATAQHKEVDKPVVKKQRPRVNAIDSIGQGETGLPSDRRTKGTQGSSCHRQPSKLESSDASVQEGI